ncbi:hypothetical protein Trco_003181 [Trichoderma cornu-damae]|uniref:Uncharacterized protein n=1 Tax=Trichoderma cornu-damae TaxID=654480 RepID=A0A9P8QQU7_9HYPO|nr:hypothetical protein Trco_003181 [Trichoderma cornu-damae]
MPDNPPPTMQSTPPSPTPSTTSSTQPAASPAVDKTGTRTPDLPTASAASSSHGTPIAPTVIGSDGSGGGETGGWGRTENAEERCVCLNASFDVAEIAGLCASCIGMVANTQNDMEIIMSVCGFPPQQYDPGKDILAANIWVKASRPTAEWAGSAKMSRASRSTRVASVGPVMGVAVGFGVGALMML